MSALGGIRRTLRYGWQLGAVLALLWIGLAGASDWVPGLVVIAFAVVVSYRFAPMERPHFRLPGLWRFCGYFLSASLRGGIDITRRALDPRLPLEITNWKHHFRVPPGQQRTVLVATISLLPGTLSRGLDNDGVLINSIAGDQHLEIEKLEQLIGDMFGVALDKDHG